MNSGQCWKVRSSFGGGGRCLPTLTLGPPAPLFLRPCQASTQVSMLPLYSRRTDALKAQDRILSQTLSDNWQPSQSMEGRMCGMVMLVTTCYNHVEQFVGYYSFKLYDSHVLWLWSRVLHIALWCNIEKRDMWSTCETETKLQGILASHDSSIYYT